MVSWLFAAQLIVAQTAVAPDDIADHTAQTNPTEATDSEAPEPPPAIDPVEQSPTEPSLICERGATRACVCTDGAGGAQQCVSGDSGWGTCECDRPEPAPAPAARERRSAADDDYQRPRRQRRSNAALPPPDGEPAASIEAGDITLACAGSLAGYVASACVLGVTYWLCPPSILTFPLLQSYVMVWISDAYTERRGAVIWSALAGYAAWFAGAFGLIAFAVAVGLVGAAIGAVVGVAAGTGGRDAGAWGYTAGLLGYLAASPLVTLAMGIAPVVAWYYGSEAKQPNDNGGGFPGFLVPSTGSRPTISDRSYAMAY